MKTPSITQVLDDIKSRFEENLASNLIIIPANQAEVVMFATKVLAETITEVALDMINLSMSGNQPSLSALPALPAATVSASTPQAIQKQMDITYPYTTNNINFLLDSYKTYQTMLVRAYTPSNNIPGAWAPYYTCVSLDNFKGFLGSMNKEDPTLRYRLSTLNPLLVMPDA